MKAIATDPDLLVRAFTGVACFDRVLELFRAQVEPLVDAGLEVIIPAGGLPSLLFSRLKKFCVGEAVVVNCIAVLAKAAETAVALHRLDGTTASRAATFRRPSAQALREFLDH